LLRALVLVGIWNLYGQPALAVVPSGNTVPLIGNAGNFSSAVEIFN
jgi:hypothetical protein